MKLTPEVLFKLYPGVYWAVYRRGFAEAKSDPNTRAQIAEEYLKNGFANAAPATSTAKASSQPQPATGIDPVQASINRQLGLDEATFQKFANGR